jgi:ABC-type multidrug transport system fused ATPase/permease subunit
VRYTANGPDVLKDISFTIKSGDRVAIVGRTGSGKSTLALSCLRIPHISSGSIIYDGINIADRPVQRLRESLSIIPQDTILFGGEIKDNLDPGKALDLHNLENVFNTCSHVRALAYYKNSEELPSKLSLSTKVEAGGANFSEGQRQILGLARALVKRSKLVLLDEATASMDYETDAAIQDLLRSEMKVSTVITIAHRLRSIIDYDRVIVMADGQIVE